MTTVIEVFPNPYIAIDKDGVPQGVVSIPGMPNTYVGARRDAVASRLTGKDRFFFPLGIKRHPDGSREPGDGRARVHFSPEIAQSVRAGELIAADAETARICGVSKFLEVDEAIERERGRARAYLRSLTTIDPKDPRYDAIDVKNIPREATPEPVIAAPEGAEGATTQPAKPAPGGSAIAAPPGTPVTPTVSIQHASAPARAGEEG